MPVEKPSVPIGEAIHAAYVDALDTWAREHAKGRHPDEALAEDLTGAVITANIAQRQGTYVYVEVQARRPWEAATYGYRLLHQGKRLAHPRPHRIL